MGVIETAYPRCVLPTYELLLRYYYHAIIIYAIIMLLLLRKFCEKVNL